MFKFLMFEYFEISSVTELLASMELIEPLTINEYILSTCLQIKK